MADRSAPTPADRVRRASSWVGGVLSALLAASVASLAGTPAMDLLSLLFVLLAVLSAAAAHYQLWMVQRSVRAAEVEDAVYRVLRDTARKSLGREPTVEGRPHMPEPETDMRRRDLDVPHSSIPDMTIPNPNAALNTVAVTMSDLFGWLPLSVRYAAAEAAMAEAYRYIHDRENR